MYNYPFDLQRRLMHHCNRDAKGTDHLEPNWKHPRVHLWHGRPLLAINHHRGDHVAVYIKQGLCLLSGETATWSRIRPGMLCQSITITRELLMALWAATNDENILNLKFSREVRMMERWKCTVCGYIYDEEKGDQENNVPSGTRFADLPENWICPLCGATRDMFEKVSWKLACLLSPHYDMNIQWTVHINY